MNTPGTASKTKSPGDTFLTQIPESHGDRGIIPISLKRERESAETGLARAVRNVSLNASASGGSRPTSSVTTTPPPTTKSQPKAHTRASPELNGDRGALTRIAEQVRNARTVALDIETYGERRGDGLDPWKGDIRLLSLCVENQQPWIIDLRAIGYDLGELKTALEAVEIIAHNAKFDLLWLRVKCGLRATRVFCTLVAARLLSAGTKPGNDLDKCLER